GRVHDLLPGPELRQREGAVRGARVQHEQQSLARHRAPPVVDLVARFAVDQQAEPLRIRAAPVLGGHLDAHGPRRGDALRYVGAPRKKLRRRSTGCWRRIANTSRVKASSSRARASSVQCTQLMSLSWQYALLLPFCVRPSSSPWLTMGTPCEKARVARKLRAVRSRRASTSARWVSPATPQLWLQLASLPSWLSSPLASLCFCS